MARQIYGVVDHRGRIISGGGFTCRPESRALYTITFSEPFNSIPAVLLTVTRASPYDTYVTPIAEASKDKAVLTFDTESGPLGASFSIFVIGD